MSDSGRTSGASPARARKFVLCGLAFGVLLVVLYANPLFTRRNFAGRDLVVYNLPMEKGIHDAYARGHFPLWMPYISGGRPLLPNPNAGALYPLRILLSPLPFAVEMRLYPLIHWMAAAVGMIVLARAIGASVSAAWISAVTYVFSGVVVSEVFFTHIEPGMALLPWIVWCVQRIDQERVGSLVLLSGLLGIDMLAGDVFTVGLAILSALLWILLEESREQWPGRLVLLVLAVLLAALIAAPQIIATLLWIPETNRAVMGMQLGEVLHYSIPPWRLLEFVVPYPFGPTWDLNETDVWSYFALRRNYVGLFVTLYVGALGVIAVVASARDRRRGSRFLRALLFLMLVAAVLPGLLPDSMGLIRSPLPLRNPEKFAVAIAFSLALTSGLFLDRVGSSWRLPRWTIGVGGLLALLALGSRLFPQLAGSTAVALTGSGMKLAGAAASQLPKRLSEAGLLWMGTVIALDLLAGREQKRSLIPALLLLTVVPIASNRRIARTYREEDVLSPTPLARFVKRQDPEGKYRVLGASMSFDAEHFEPHRVSQDMGFLGFARNSWHEHTQALFGYGTVFNGDFDSGDLARIEALRHVSSRAVRFKDSQNFFRSFSLRWATRYRQQGPAAGYHPVGGDGIWIWDELAGALPDIRLVEKWRAEAGSLAALRVLPSLDAGEIVIERETAQKGTARPGTLRILEKQPERLRLETRTVDPTWLFVLRGFWNWRTVTIDGREVDVYPAQLAFSTIKIPAGLHQVDWREGFPGLQVSLFGPLLFALIACGLIVSRRWRIRERTS
jgi:hypothetical protein